MTNLWVDQRPSQNKRSRIITQPSCSKPRSFPHANRSEQQASEVFILEKRYRKCGFITRQAYDEVSAGIAEFPKLKLIDQLIEDKAFKLVALPLSQRKDFRELLG